MQGRDSLILELEETIARGSSSRHADALRRMTDLFVRRAPGLNDEHIEVFDDVILRLAGEIEVKARAELARRLAPIDNAPVNTIRRLAQDDAIEVAAPVLLRSSRLAEGDLVEIARTKSQAHLLAIAGRRDLGESVTDILVGRGDSDVLFNVASNPGAGLSANGFETLVEKAENDESLAVRVGEREDIPPHLFHNLLARASELVQRRLLESASASMRGEIKDVLIKVSQEIDPAAPVARSFIPAERLIRMLHESGSLGENELHDLARSKRYEETVAALAQLCAVSIEIIDGLMNGIRLEPLLVLLKAAGYEWLTVRAIILLRPSGRKLSARELADICDDYSRLSYATARRVVQHWKDAEAELRAAS